MSLNEHPVIALVPARGGSKGVLRKNMRMVHGQPLLQFTLSAAQSAQRVDAVYLSSEDAEILALGQTLGVETISRPAEFASDTASAIDVVKHFVGVLTPELIHQDPYIVYLQPTSPLRTSDHIDAALGEMESNKAHTLVSVVELSKSPFKSFSIDCAGRLESLFDERLSNARRQDLPATYIPNGAIYIFRVSDFLNREGFPSNGSLPFIMSGADSVDIDTEQDIKHLEQILGEKHG